jgi:hypothetical protein
VGVKITGLDEVRRNLRKLGDRARQLHGNHEIRFDELFNPDFMARFTNYGTIDEMVQASGFKVESADDFKQIPDAKWDAFVRQSTRFANWREMQQKAASEWAARRLGLRK